MYILARHPLDVYIGICAVEILRLKFNILCPANAYLYISEFGDFRLKGPFVK